MSKIDDKQVVYVNTLDRISGTTSRFTFNIALKAGNSFDRVTLLQASIPKSYYNCQTGNNYFDLLEGVTTVRIYITEGNYTRNSFAVVLKNLLNTYSPGGLTYTITYNNPYTQADSGKYTYTVSSGNPSFIFDVAATASGGSDVHELMGFDSSSTYTFSGSSLVSVNVVNLQPFSAIQIHSNVVSDTFAVGKNTDILQTIFANVGIPPYGNVQWICPEFESFSHLLASGNTGTAEFYLTDENNAPLDLNGVEIQLVVMFWKKNTALTSLTKFLKMVAGLFVDNN